MKPYQEVRHRPLTGIWLNLRALLEEDRIQPEEVRRLAREVLALRGDEPAGHVLLKDVARWIVGDAANPPLALFSADGRLIAMKEWMIALGFDHIEQARLDILHGWRRRTREFQNDVDGDQPGGQD
jgi:hypothetical protein